jgi:hypothetical protein
MSQNAKRPARGTQPDYYRILGVDGNASPEEIVEAYRALVLQCHPDLNPGDPQAEARFLAVQAAFEVLSDPVRRTAYDRTRGPYRTYVPSKIDPLAWHVHLNPPPRRPRVRRKLHGGGFTLPLIVWATVLYLVLLVAAGSLMSSSPVSQEPSVLENVRVPAMAVLTLAYAVVVAAVFCIKPPQ